MDDLPPLLQLLLVSPLTSSASSCMRCSSHPEWFGVMKGMEGSCCSHLLPCLCTISLETKVSVCHVGLGSCPFPPCPSISILHFGAARSSCSMAWGYKTMEIHLSWGWDISAQVRVVFSQAWLSISFQMVLGMVIFFLVLIQSRSSWEPEEGINPGQGSGWSRGDG